MIDYGNEKLNQIFRDTWPNLGWAKRMTEFAGNYEGPLYARHPDLVEPIHAKVSNEDYQKILDAFDNPQPYPDEMFEEAERREKSNRVLERYNRFYNMECASLPYGTPITPEHQQMITLQSMIDALRCENLNHEFDVVSTDDINALIEGLYQQGRESLKKWEEFKDSADGVA